MLRRSRIGRVLPLGKATRATGVGIATCNHVIFGRKDIPFRTIGVKTPITNSAGLCNTDRVWRSVEHCQRLFVGHVNSNWLNLLAVGGVVTRSPTQRSQNSIYTLAGPAYMRTPRWPKLVKMPELVGYHSAGRSVGLWRRTHAAKVLFFHAKYIKRA